MSLKSRAILWTVIAIIASILTSLMISTTIYLINAIILGNQDRGNDIFIKIITFSIYYLPIFAFIVFEFYFYKTRIKTSEKWSNQEDTPGQNAAR